MKDKKAIKRFLAFFLCAAMLVIYMPTMSFALADESADDVVTVQEEPAPAPAAEPASEPAPAADPEPSVETPADEPAAPEATEPDPEDVVTEDIDAPADAEDVIEEEPAEAEPEADAEEYPAVTLSKTVDGVTVTLKAPEGALPEGAQLKVTAVNSQAVFNAVEERVEAEGKEMTDAVAFDVTPLDKDGNEIQPRVPVTVTFSNTGLEGSDVDVFRVSDDASVVTEMGTSVATSQKQVFSTDHFTIYVSASTASDPQGDGQSSGSRYVLEYGENVVLGSDDGTFSSSWSVSPSSNYYDFSGTTVTNKNTGTSVLNITVRHRYRNWEYSSWGIPYIGSEHNDYFYITLKPQVLTVTFMLQDAGEGSFSEYSSAETYSGGSVEAPAMVETKEVDGTTYTFYGWCSDEGCQNAASFTGITSSITVYGKYTTEASIRYKKNTSDSATVPEEQKGGVGNKVTLGDATRSGHVLNSWNTAADGSGDSYQPGDSVTIPEGGMTLYAQWSDDEMVMRYNYNYTGAPGGGVFRSVSNIPKNSQTTLLSDIPTRPSVLGIHFVFRGWATSAGASDPQYYPGETYHTGSSNMVNLYAVWGTLSLNDLETLTANSDTVTYDGEEHSISGVTGGTPWSRDPNYVKVGDTAIFGFDIYAYIGDIKASGTNAGHYSTPLSAPLYYLTGSRMLRLFDDPYIEIEGGTLWIQQAELTISTDSAEKQYDGTELTAGGKVTLPDGTEVTFSHEGEAVSLYKNDTLNMRTTGSQTEVGHSENGFELDWGKPDDWGTTASTAYKYNYKIIDEADLGTLTVYYGVVFEKNTEDDVTGMPEGAKAYKDDETGDITAEIPSDEPSREHYKFLGWAESADATEADYQPGDTVTVTSDKVTDGAMTLYAVWEIEKFTVTFKDEDGTVLSETEYPYGTAAADIEKPADPTKASDGSYTYTFAGWSPEIADVTEDATYTASYDATAIPPAADDDDDTPAVVPAAAATTGGDAAEPEEIEDEPTPEAEPEVIDDEPTPEALPDSAWALLNLIAAVLTAFGAAFALTRKKEDGGEDDPNSGKAKATKGIGIALAAAALITLFVTESFGGTMQMTDKWTALMAVMLAGEAVSAGLTGKFTK